MNKKQIILVDTGSESNHMMMTDVGNMENAVQLSDLYRLNNNNILKKIFQLHFGFILNRKFDIPIKNIWDSRCVLNELIFDSNCEYYLILVNDVIRKFSDSYLNKINKMKNVHTFIILLDSYEKLQPYFQRCVDKVRVDRVYSFQKSDCEKRFYNYTNMLYSKIDMRNISEGVVSDCYFIGAEKDRIKDIILMYDIFSHKGYKCNFIVIVSKFKIKAYQKAYPEIDFRIDRVRYQDVLKDIKSTKCILELCQEGQDGLTMRFYEAVFYNKYLVTNNYSAMNHELYNDLYINVIKSVNDIDVEKIDLNKYVDYYYKNQMSPSHLVNNIVNKKEIYRGFLI